MAVAPISVKQALDTQADIKSRREHCAAAARMLASLGGALGRQVRIRHDDEFALFTVSELLHETSEAVVRIGPSGRQRLGSEGGFASFLDTEVVDPDLCDADARAAGELVERLDDDGSQAHLIAIAPHGGAIEAHTDEQAERVVERLGRHLASSWRGKGWRPNGGAFERWHITSTDLDPTCFPLLDSVMNRSFAHAVAFHGFDDEPGVLIGGTAPGELKERIRQAIERVLPTTLAVRIAAPDERYGGDDPRNIVNRLSPCGGIQIEQGATPREAQGRAIADAVADVFRAPRRVRPSPGPSGRMRPCLSCMESAGGYVFASQEMSAEEARLDMLEELFDRDSQRLLDGVGLERGGRFLEVGAGHGGLVSFLLARCGARGQVVATDIDTRFLDQFTHPRLRVLHHDVLTDDVEQLGKFDVVHARFVLHHLGERAGEGVARLCSLLTPGGRIVVEDPLWDNRYDPTYPDADRMQAEDDEFEQVARERGLDMQVAATYPRRLVELGLVDVDSEIRSAVRRGGDLYSRFLDASTAASTDEISYEEVYDGGVDQVVNALRDPALFYVSWHRLAAWGTRPA